MFVRNPGRDINRDPGDRENLYCITPYPYETASACGGFMERSEIEAIGGKYIAILTLTLRSNSLQRLESKPSAPSTHQHSTRRTLRSFFAFLNRAAAKRFDKTQALNPIRDGANCGWPCCSSRLFLQAFTRV
jgi:hypothetical protein